MTPPTPAAVRYVFNLGEATPEERAAYYTGGRAREDVLRDHIRAVAQEMRESAKTLRYQATQWPSEAADGCNRQADSLAKFADKLEGKQL